MAYLNFREAELSGSLHGVLAATQEPATSAADKDNFSALEWQVVTLAERDRLGSLRRPGRIGAALTWLFAWSERRLASPRLEALRRLAVYGWHRGHNVPPSELAAFRAAGFSSSQAELLLDTILSRRATRRARRHA